MKKSDKKIKPKKKEEEVALTPTTNGPTLEPQENNIPFIDQTPQ